MSKPAPPRAAPPPFSPQRSRSWLVFGCLTLTVGAVVVAGTFLTVPTYVSTSATVEDPAACAALGVPAGPVGCVRLGLDPGFDDALAARIAGRLTTADGPPVPVELVRASSGPDELVLAGAVAAAPGPGPVTAVVDVGRRPLGQIFLGRGLKAEP